MKGKGIYIKYIYIYHGFSFPSTRSNRLDESWSQRELGFKCNYMLYTFGFHSFLLDLYLIKMFSKIELLNDSKRRVFGWAKGGNWPLGSALEWDVWLCPNYIFEEVKDNFIIPRRTISFSLLYFKFYQSQLVIYIYFFSL